jgi:hypothetical protein
MTPRTDRWSDADVIKALKAEAKRRKRPPTSLEWGKATKHRPCARAVRRGSRDGPPRSQSRAWTTPTRGAAVGDDVGMEWHLTVGRLALVALLAGCVGVTSCGGATRASKRAVGSNAANETSTPAKPCSRGEVAVIVSSAREGITACANASDAARQLREAVKSLCPHNTITMSGPYTARCGKGNAR